MSLEFKVEGAEGIARSAEGFRKARSLIRKRVYDDLLWFGNMTLSTIKKDFLTGPRPGKLGVGTGRLRSSIRFKVFAKDDEMQLTFGTDVPYAAIHEFGGKTRPHVIRPKRKPFLAFIKNGQWVYTRKEVQHPGSAMPARPYMRPGIEQELPKLRGRLMETLKLAATGAFSGEQQA